MNCVERGRREDGVHSFLWLIEEADWEGVQVYHIDVGDENGEDKDGWEGVSNLKGCVGGVGRSNTRMLTSQLSFRGKGRACLPLPSFRDVDRS
jgi:hypothetical protein